MLPDVCRPGVYNPNTHALSNKSIFCLVDLPLTKVSFYTPIYVNTHIHISTKGL